MSYTLSVHLDDARNLTPNCQAYAKVKLGSTERKSPPSPKGAQNPYWVQDFTFDVDDLGDELSISIWSLPNAHQYGYLRLPVQVLLYAQRQAIPSSWFRLCSSKSKTPTPGEVRVGFSLSKRRAHEEEGSALLSFFEDDAILVQSSPKDMPTPLGGVLLSDTYHVSARTLNKILFGPGSQFLKDLHELQKTTNVVEMPWTKGEDNLPQREITYTKAATKLVKPVKATETQKYSRADEKGFVVDVSAMTPGVPCGDTFKVKLQFCIFAGAGENTSSLRVSWGLQFLKSTVMKAAIEKGTCQGLQESYKQYAQVLKKALMAGGEVRNAEPVQPKSSVDVSLKSDARECFCRIRVCITLLSIIFLVLALMYKTSHSKSGLEDWKLDLPLTLLSAFLGAQIQSFIGMARNRRRARPHGGKHPWTSLLLSIYAKSICCFYMLCFTVLDCIFFLAMQSTNKWLDYGARAKGNGWVIAMTLGEAQNLPASSAVLYCC